MAPDEGTIEFFDIVEFSLIKQVSQVSFVCKWYTEDLQDLIGRSFQFHIMMDNSHETIG